MANSNTSQYCKSSRFSAPGSGRATARHNAAIESFFSSLKTERTGNKTYRTRDQAKADVFDYIERFAT
jgi:transposase InsO family protein